MPLLALPYDPRARGPRGFRPAYAMLVASLGVLACAPDGDVKIGGDPAGDSAAPAPPTVEIAGAAAIDPLLGGVATYAVSDAAAVVTVLDTEGDVVRTLTGDPTWDGRDEAGAVVPLGGYTVRAELVEDGAVVATDEALTQVVRVGLTTGTLGGERIALCWHVANGRGGYGDGGTDTPTFQLAGIDTDGVPTAIPEPWADLDVLPTDPVGQNLPAAYAWDARPTLTLTVDGEIGGAALSAAIEGWTLTQGEAAPGGTLVFTRDAPLAEGPRVVEETLTLTWMAGDAVVGMQAIPLRMYALLGPPAFEETGLPYQPWLAVIDPALRAIEGVEPDEGAVISALVDHVYYDLGLAYDTRWGASAYTQYSGDTYDDAHFDLTGFLARRRGSTVNCTDCAAILEAFANMLGASLSYTIILQDFSLNQIRAIGATEYTNCPFGSGGCGFSYHAVTTSSDGATIWDATLALDGDDDPGALPATELLVQAIGADDYLDRLVLGGRVRYAFQQKETIQ